MKYIPSLVVLARVMKTLPECDGAANKCLSPVLDLSGEALGYLEFKRVQVKTLNGGTRFAWLYEGEVDCSWDLEGCFVED